VDCSLAECIDEARTALNNGQPLADTAQHFQDWIDP
jgi:hypothetical protein